MGRNSIGTAAVYGLKEDLGMTGYQYSWTGSIMYFAFLLWIFPTLYLLQRFPTGKYLACNIIGWGIVELCHAACTNPASLLVCRFLLGLFQCCDLPAMIIIASESILDVAQRGRVTNALKPCGGRSLNNRYETR